MDPVSVEGRLEREGYALMPAALPEAHQHSMAKAWTEAWNRSRASGALTGWATTTVESELIPLSGDPLTLLDARPVLALLATPTVLSAIRYSVGEDALPAVTWTVHKTRKDGHVLPWHQDTVYDRRWRVLTVGYHCAGRDGTGGVRLIPGTHTTTQDMDRIDATYAWDQESVVTLRPEPGDVVLHDAMTVHGSPEETAAPGRLTVYVEFRSARHVLETETGMGDWVQARRRLLVLADRISSGEEVPSDMLRSVVSAAQSIRRAPGMRNQSYRGLF